MSLYSSLTQVLAPFAARLNGLLTGYDGTVYSTPGEAVRTQINDLHVLIGHVPGQAIDASAVAYNDSNVAAELTNVNGRLPLQVRLSTNGTAPPGTFGKIVTAFSKGAVVYGYTSTSGKVLYTLTSVDLVSTPLDYDVGTLTFTHVRADVGWLSQIQLKYLGEDETWSYSSYDVADKMTSQEATNLLSIAKGGS